MASSNLITVKPPAHTPGFRIWPTDKLVQVRPNKERPVNVQDVLLDGEPIGQIECYTRRIRSKVGRTNFVREHAQRKTWQPISDELHNPNYDRRWEAVRDVIENHQRAVYNATMAEARAADVPSFAPEVAIDDLEVTWGPEGPRP